MNPQALALIEDAAGDALALEPRDGDLHELYMIPGPGGSPYVLVDAADLAHLFLAACRHEATSMGCDIERHTATQLQRGRERMEKADQAAARSPPPAVATVLPGAKASSTYKKVDDPRVVALVAAVAKAASHSDRWGEAHAALLRLRDVVPERPNGATPLFETILDVAPWGAFLVRSEGRPSVYYTATQADGSYEEADPAEWGEVENFEPFDGEGASFLLLILNEALGMRFDPKPETTIPDWLGPL